LAYAVRAVRAMSWSSQPRLGPTVTVRAVRWAKSMVVS
jgi:hypothetical protein